MFQSTPSRRGRRQRYFHCIRGQRSFNPLPHAEGDRYCHFCFQPCVCFNPLPHAEGDPFLLHGLVPSLRFNPLPHAEGDVDWYDYSFPLKVFQSTPSRRGRQIDASGCLSVAIVSIHSLTQRETRKPSVLSGGSHSFNPLPHAEGDCCPLNHLRPYSVFQSTPSRRGRLLPHCCFRVNCYVSIHSLTQRETLKGFQKFDRKYVSIHSLTQRETLLPHILCPSFSVSIHSLTQRETGNTPYNLPNSQFQSTPSRRGRPVLASSNINSSRFNPLPHAEGDFK